MTVELQVRVQCSLKLQLKLLLLIENNLMDIISGCHDKSTA